MAKTLAGHAASATVATGRAATSAVRGVHSQLPLPQPPSYGGYWSFVSASLILLFILYLAANNRLGVWLAFFSWTAPQSIGTATNAGVPTQAAAAGAAVGSALTGGTGTGAALGATTGAAASTLQGISNTWGSTFSNLMTKLGIPYGGAFSGSPSAGTAGQK